MDITISHAEKKGKKKNQAPFKHLIAENVNEINN